jgi:hypothetical protein
MMSGLVMWPDTIIIRFWPSGAIFASCDAAMAPLAPARFSTITAVCQAFSNSWPTSRAMMSVVPPGGKPTRILMVPFG